MREKILLAVALLLVSFAGQPLALSAASSPHESLSAETIEQSSSESSHPHFLPARGIKRRPVRGEPVYKVLGNLTYNGGPVIPSAHVVYIFWGPSFNNAGSPDYSYARELQSFRNQFGTTPEYNTITQYSGFNGTIALTNLAAGTADWFDTSTPPTNVTDAIAQSEVNTYLATYGFDASAIYEIVLPSTSYSSYGTQTSCGGPNLFFCAYHYFFNSGANTVKYSLQPYPSCGSCQTGGWTAAQNQEHFVEAETVDFVTDPNATGCVTIADKCAWSPTPFLLNGFGYQYLWLNAAGACVR